MSLDGVRSALFGTRVRIAATALVSLFALVAAAFAVGAIGVPSVEGVDNEFGDVNDSHTEIHTELHVFNPNPIGARSVDASAEYVVRMNGVEMARGRGDRLEIPPGDSTEEFTTHMENDRVPEWWVTHVGNDEESEVVIDATIHSGALDRSAEITRTRTVETDLLSSFDSDETRPVNADVPLVEDPVLYVNGTRGEWGAVDAEHTEMDLRFDMYNPKSYDILLTRIGYTIYMNDVVVGEGETGHEYLLRSGQETEVETATAIENENLDEWWVTHVRNDQVTDLRIEFSAQLEPFGLDTTIEIPLDPLTYEETIETDIWGEGDGSGDGAGDRAKSADGGDDADESDGEGRDDDEDGILPRMTIGSIASPTA